VLNSPETSKSSQETKKLNHNALVKAHRTRQVPELREEDLEESFIRGSGPGGQSINKVS